MKVENSVYRINIFLSLAAIALVGYLALIRMQPYSPPPLSEKRFKKQSNALLKSGYAFETKIFKTRQLFGQPIEGKPLSPEKAFVLLGISLGNRNLAMIRDTTESKDYYCVEGDRVGVFKVKQILKDKVILESEGNTLEITQ